jgi:hypothetical protein
MANTAEAWQAGAIDGHDDEPRTAVAAAELLLDGAQNPPFTSLQKFESLPISLDPEQPPSLGKI